MAEQRIQIPLIGGINRLHDPRRIRDDEAVTLKNLYPDASGKMSRRKGCKFFDRARLKAADPFGSYLTGTPCAMVWSPFTDCQYVAVTHNGSGTANLFLGRLAADALVNVLTTNMAQLYRPQFLTFQGKQSSGATYTAVLIATGVVNGASSAFMLASQGTGATSLSGGPTSFQNQAGAYLPAKVLGSYRGRVVYANFGERQENALVLSDRYRLDIVDSGGIPANLNIDTGTRTIRLPALPAGGRDRIVAVKEIWQPGQYASDQSSLLILSETRAYILSGEPLLTTATGTEWDVPTDPQVIPLPIQCGCVSAATVVETPYGILWAGPDDVWIFDGGSLPRRVGTKIRPLLQASHVAYRWTWIAAYEPVTGSYRLVINDGLRLNYPNIQEDQYWLDLREGVSDAASARWYGNMVYKIQGIADAGYPSQGVYCFARDERNDVTQALYALQQVKHPDQDPNYNTAIVKMDAQTGWDDALPDGTVGISVVALDRILGSGISFQAQSKIYDVGDLGRIKTYHALEMGFYSALPWASTLTVNADGGVTGMTRADPIDAATDGVLEDQMVQLGPSDGVALSGRKLQITLGDEVATIEGGWVITEYCDTFRFQGSDGVTRSVTLAHAIYNTRANFLGNLIQALLDADPAGVGYGHSVVTNKVRITVSVGTWRPILTPTESATFWALLGWDFMPTAGASCTADRSVRNGLIGVTEITDLILVLDAFGKRPGGVRR